jgi:hypothetical protein
MLVLAGCSGGMTGNVVSQSDSHGCSVSAQYEWCETAKKCVRPWETYCPKPGEEVKLMTAGECELKGGIALNHGGGDRCSGEVIGELAGFVSLHVCCVDGTIPGE